MLFRSCRRRGRHGELAEGEDGAEGEAVGSDDDDDCGSGRREGCSLGDAAAAFTTYSRTPSPLGVHSAYLRTKGREIPTPYTYLGTYLLPNTKDTYPVTADRPDSCTLVSTSPGCILVYPCSRHAPPQRPSPQRGGPLARHPLARRLRGRASLHCKKRRQGHSFSRRLKQAQQGRPFSCTESPRSSPLITP